MANFKFLIAGALCLSSAAHALYVTPSTPEVFKTVGGVGYLSISPSDTSFANGIRSKIAGGAARVALAGGGADIPVAYKFAVSAGKAAASLAFGWPGVFLLAGGLAYQWFYDHEFEVVNDIWMRRRNVQNVTYQMSGFSYTTDLYSSADSAKGAWLTYQLAHGWDIQLNHIEGQKYYWDKFQAWCSCYQAGGTSDLLITEGPVQQTLTPTDRAEMESVMNGTEVPFGVPQVWPLTGEPMWWPVQNPILNPSPVNPADPQAVPVPQPLRVPMGDPVPSVPQTSPETWTSPVVDIVPSPTVNDPWRVDVQPKSITTTSPDPLTIEPVPVTPPEGQTEQQRQEQLDLCALHPEILACADLDTPDSEELPTEDKSVSVSPDSGWGGNGSCPAPKHLTVQGRDIPIPLDIICQYMTGIRPIIIALAWLSAGFILIGARGGD